MPIVSELILSLMLTASLSAGAPLSAPPAWPSPFLPSPLRRSNSIPP